MSNERSFTLRPIDGPELTITWSVADHTVRASVFQLGERRESVVDRTDGWSFLRFLGEILTGDPDEIVNFMRIKLQTLNGLTCRLLYLQSGNKWRYPLFIFPTLGDPELLSPYTLQPVDKVRDPYLLDEVELLEALERIANFQDQSFS